MVDNDNVVIDLTNYKDRVGSRVPQGRYHVIVDDVEQSVSAANNTMITLGLRIVEGPFADSMLIDRLVLAEKALFRVVNFMQAIGLPTPRKRLSVNIKTWLGKHLTVDVEDGEPYNGKVKSEVRGYMRILASSDKTAVVTDVDNAQLNELAGLSAFTSESPAIPPSEGLKSSSSEDRKTSPQEFPLLSSEGSDDDVSDEIDLSQLNL